MIDTSLVEVERRGVPAVRNAAAILTYFHSTGNREAKAVDVARATELNGSTCFNLLKTLQSTGLLDYDDTSKTYRLGRYLAVLGDLVDREATAIEVARGEAQRVASQFELGCFVMGRSERGEFVVLDKVESPQPIRVTIDIGTIFPETGAVAAKAWNAYASESALRDLFARIANAPDHSRREFDCEAFVTGLAETRKLGFATSHQEYYPDHNAVAATIYLRDERPNLLLVVVGTVSQLPEQKMPEVGHALADAANRATELLGGRPPQRDPAGAGAPHSSRRR